MFFSTENGYTNSIKLRLQDLSKLLFYQQSHTILFLQY